jgi:hypothetical protein
MQGSRSSIEWRICSWEPNLGWFGYLKRKNSNNRGTSLGQRIKDLNSLLFQDYMPNIPSVKLYLNLVYNTGLPGGAPSYSDPYLYQGD